MENPIQVLQIVYHSNKIESIPDTLYLYRYNSPVSSSNAFSEEKLNVGHITGCIVAHIVHTAVLGTGYLDLRYFSRYFLLSKEAIIRYKIEYAENFIPDFLEILKKHKGKYILRGILILACKGFPYPFRILYKLRRRIKNLCKI
jgi:hypothetical protein